MHRNVLPKPERKIPLKMLNEILCLNFLCYNNSNWANVFTSYYEIRRIFTRAIGIGGPGQVILKRYVAAVMAGIISELNVNLMELVKQGKENEVFVKVILCGGLLFDFCEDLGNVMLEMLII